MQNWILGDPFYRAILADIADTEWQIVEEDFLEGRAYCAHRQLDHLEHTMRLNPARVPASMHALLYYAQAWGVTDDNERQELMQRMPSDAKAAMLAAVREHEVPLLAWLAGPDSYSSPPSLEYLAFSALLRIYDESHD